MTTQEAGIPDAVVYAAAKAMLQLRHSGQSGVGYMALARAGLEAAAPVLAAQVRREAADEQRQAGLVVVSAELLDALTDTDECWFDHHGGCQAHGFLSLEPGERCPHAEAREILAALPERTEP